MFICLAKCFASQSYNFIPPQTIVLLSHSIQMKCPVTVIFYFMQHSGSVVEAEASRVRGCGLGSWCNEEGKVTLCPVK